MFRTKKTEPVPARPPGGDVAALAEQLSTARGRLELLGGDSANVLTEVPSESELAEQRGLAEWKRGQLRRADRAELSAQLDAAEAIREAEAQIREADIRDAIDARKALAAQRRADTPASTIAELHRYSRWTRYGCAAIIAAGMLWSAVNVQHNMAPGGTSDPMFWVSFLVEGMISGLLVIIAVGTAKNREAAGVEPSPGLQWAEVGLFALTLALNTYPYLAATHWYQASLHGIAPCLIGGALLVLHYLGKDYTKARAVVAQRITSDVAMHLPDLRTLHTPQPSIIGTAVAPSTAPAVAQEQPVESARTTDPIDEFEAEFDPAPEPALPPAPHYVDEESAAPHRTSPEVHSTAILDTSAGSAAAPHFESAGSEGTDTVVVESAPHQPSEESADTSAGAAAPVAEEAPEPARTETSTTSTSNDALEVTASAGEVREEVRAPRAPRSRTAHPSRTSGAGSSAPASAGSRTQAALALSPVESAGTSAVESAGTDSQVRASLTALANEVRGRGAGGRLPVETVVRVLEALDRGASVNAAHTATGVHRRTVERIRDTAAVLLAEAVSSGTGGRVIELRKTDRT
ncbi:hypothetical protein OG225_43565 (plasmid) [Nocardia sp. NBC_01377]|uniref:hypothetical protein n=1 Tax=Nocardia sp. NBC_01377 TaxID=2903595 RepID=UPI002F90867A